MPKTPPANPITYEKFANYVNKINHSDIPKDRVQAAYQRYLANLKNPEVIGPIGTTLRQEGLLPEIRVTDMRTLADRILVNILTKPVAGEIRVDFGRKVQSYGTPFTKHYVFCGADLTRQGTLPEDEKEEEIAREALSDLETALNAGNLCFVQSKPKGAHGYEVRIAQTQEKQEQSTQITPAPNPQPEPKKPLFAGPFQMLLL